MMAALRSGKRPLIRRQISESGGNNETRVVAQAGLRGGEKKMKRKKWIAGIREQKPPRILRGAERIQQNAAANYDWGKRAKVVTAACKREKIERNQGHAAT